MKKGSSNLFENDAINTNVLKNDKKKEHRNLQIIDYLLMQKDKLYVFSGLRSD